MCAVYIVDIFWIKEYFKYVFTTAITYLGTIIVKIQIFYGSSLTEILDTRNILKSNP